jgi:hypothetical protein
VFIQVPLLEAAQESGATSAAVKGKRKPYERRRMREPRPRMSQRWVPACSERQSLPTT